MKGTLLWMGVGVGTAVLTALGALWLLGRRAVARFRRERLAKACLPDAMVPDPSRRLPTQKNP